MYDRDEVISKEESTPFWRPEVVGGSGDSLLMGGGPGQLRPQTTETHPRDAAKWFS